MFFWNLARSAAGFFAYLARNAAAFADLHGSQVSSRFLMCRL
jgi:hypothetical protein